MAAEFIQTLDFRILDLIQENLRSPVCDAVMAVITKMSDHGAVWIMLGLGLAFTGKYRKTGIVVIAVLAAGFFIFDLGVKNIVCRPRPFTYAEIELLISPPSGYSFPSGHSLASFSSASVLLGREKKLGAPAVVLAALTAFSRVYLYVHFPSDVVCGAIFGIALGAAGCFVVEKISGKRRGGASPGNENPS